MRYLLMLTHDPAVEQAGAPGVVDDWVEMTRLLEAAGVLVAGDALHPADVATTVRLREGARVLSDGPWAETTESLIGYYLIDVADLDQAVSWAARMPNQRYGSVEIRPVMATTASSPAPPT